MSNQFLKRLSLGLVSSIMLGAGALAGASAEAPCYFSCKEVPPADRVLYHVGKATQKELPADEIRMLVWNVYKGGKPRFFEVFADLLKYMRPHMVLMEEATLDSNVLPAMQSLPAFGWEMSANFLMSGGVPTGPAIGSAVKAGNVRYERTLDREPFVESPKTTVIAEYPIHGSKQTLLVAAIHGINFTSDAALERQMNEVSALFDQHQGPIVFAGDFNIRNYNRAQMAMNVATRHGLTRAPWEGSDPLYYQLDDAYTRGVKIITADVWRDDVEDVGSDHPALFLKFQPEVR